MTGVMTRLRIGVRLAIGVLALLALGGGVVSAQPSPAQDPAIDPALLRGATPIALEFEINTVSSPGQFSLNDRGLHITNLGGVDRVSGDLSGTAITLTTLDWAAPCQPDTLVCLGAQTSSERLTINDAAGQWTGILILSINSAKGVQTVQAFLVGRGGNAGHILYLNKVTGRTHVSLSVSGYRIDRTAGGQW